MEPSLSRLQLHLLSANYAVVALISALLVYQRYLQYVRHLEDVAAAGGMYAGVDLLQQPPRHSLASPIDSLLS